MNSRAMVALILGGTLLLGAMLGAFGVGALAQQRREGPRPPPGDGGFVAHMERVIEPRDEEQRAAVRPYLEATDADNRAAISRAEEQMRNGLLEMSRQLEGILDEAQSARLASAIARSRPLSPGPDNGRRRGPPGAGPPPRDGDGPRPRPRN